MQEQVTSAGGAVEMAEVSRIEPRGDDWAVETDSGEIVASAVIVATGSNPRKLGVEREDDFEGKGLSHCASCDGPLYGGKLVAMVGGGDSALLETLELTGHDVRVVLIHPDEALRGQETYRRRISESPAVEVRHGTALEEILGDGRVSGVRVRELASGESSTVPVDGLFVHVGRLPSTAWLDGVLALDTGGHVPTDIWMRTEAPGLFAAGDVRANAAGQAVSAAGDGATAAIAAHRYLAERAAVRAWRLSDAFGIDRLELEERPDPRARAIGGARPGARGLAQLPRRRSWSSTGIAPRGVQLPLLTRARTRPARSSRSARASRACGSATAWRPSSSSAGSTATRSCRRTTARCSTAGSTACSPTTSSARGRSRPRAAEHLSDEEASTLPCAAVTAWHALVTKGHVRAGGDGSRPGHGRRLDLRAPVRAAWPERA